MSSDKEKSGIRVRLLESAGQVFAEKGYEKSTIREICERAKANIAAVNYYFRDKEGLYREVFNFAHGAVREHLMVILRESEGASAEDQLRLFVRVQVQGLLGSQGPPAWFSTLMTREMIEPTHMQREIIQREIGPRFELLAKIIHRLLGETASDEQVYQCTLSVVGQSVFYKLAGPIISILNPEQRYDGEDIERLVFHVSEFSLAGIARRRKEIMECGGEDEISFTPPRASGWVEG